VRPSPFPLQAVIVSTTAEATAVSAVAIRVLRMAASSRDRSPGDRPVTDIVPAGVRPATPRGRSA
jgi:hypothetical protein